MKLSQLHVNIIENVVNKMLPMWDNNKGRPKALPKRRLIEIFMWKTFTGASWETLASMLRLECDRRTLNRNYLTWVRAGVFERVFKTVRNMYISQKNRKGLSSNRHDWRVIDSSHVKNVYGTECTGANATDRGRKGTKLSIMTDSKGIPYIIDIIPSNKNDCVSLETLCCKYKGDRGKRLQVYLDKGYVSRRNERYLSSLGYVPEISKRATRSRPLDYEARMYNKMNTSKRHGVENCFAWLKQCMSVRIRRDKSLVSFAAMCHMAATKLIIGRLDMLKC